MNFSEQNPCISSEPSVFQFGTFLSAALSECRYISTSGLSLGPCNSFFFFFFFFFHISHPFSLSVLFFLFPYFIPKYLSFLCIWLLICPRAFPIDLLVEFSFVIFERPLLFVLLDPVPVFFEFSFFHQYFFYLSLQVAFLLFCFGPFHSSIFLHDLPSLALSLVDFPLSVLLV